MGTINQFTENAYWGLFVFWKKLGIMLCKLFILINTCSGFGFYIGINFLADRVFGGDFLGCISFGLKHFPYDWSRTMVGSPYLADSKYDSSKRAIH